ncbi:hypothetical protein BABINDRAFT_161363 [Babjeviella inositovora NRRL Y-12698]|uniref:non-specific serine/threonine protein kinase n=1 Tax=Babjeviella inositovora NRRL Y-12698 TaxID=984486 RepID=A0A1E3QRX8_9ASCO|nr:uncharacterized protein BABINDRAFT_161363 [Babjeviella inositovora NRRL Y-12698]ODQ80420.1 hypothetical protein BABINDRAFT_161363 [Babjeviella inositovora NRRL Y-12698]
MTDQKPNLDLPFLLNNAQPLAFPQNMVQSPPNRQTPRMALSVTIPPSDNLVEEAVEALKTPERQGRYADLSSLPTPIVASENAFGSFTSPKATESSYVQQQRSPPVYSQGALHIPKYRKLKQGQTITSNDTSHSNSVNSRILSEYRPRDIGYTVTSPQHRNFSVSGIPELEGGLKEASHIEPPREVLGNGETFAAKDRQQVEHRWRTKEELGQGSFSKVVLGEDMALGALAAIKITKYPAAKHLRLEFENSINLEIATLRHVCHPNIIQLLGTSNTDEENIMVLPYCSGGDLFHMTINHYAEYTPMFIRRIFAELSCGVAYLHQSGYVHRDIKLENILLNCAWEGLAERLYSNSPLVTISDFGLSKHYLPATDPPLTTRCGSDDYVAPEILMGVEYDGTLTDTWSMGVVLYALLENRLPFDPVAGTNPTSSSRRARSRTAHRIARIEWDWMLLKSEDGEETGAETSNATMAELAEAHLRNHLSLAYAEAKWIVTNCLIRKDKRWRIGDILAVPWVRGAIPDYEN